MMRNYGINHDCRDYIFPCPRDDHDYGQHYADVQFALRPPLSAEDEAAVDRLLDEGP